MNLREYCESLKREFKGARRPLTLHKGEYLPIEPDEIQRLQTVINEMENLYSLMQNSPSVNALPIVEARQANDELKNIQDSWD